MPATERYGAGLLPRADARRSIVQIDAGFCELHQDLDRAEIDPRMPTLDENDQQVPQPIGAPLPLDLDSMGPIGKSVVGVGRTRGFQRGTITAFAFEFIADDDRRHWSDFLVVGDGDDEFSDPGDSGKLIVTSEGLRPVALMWGGEWARRRHGRELENWSNATDVNWVLDRLGIEVVRS